MNTALAQEKKKADGLSERLKKAYKRVSPSLRPDAIIAFCKYHRISAETFRKKRCGLYTVTEQECEWMEDYKPYQEPATV